MSYLKDIRKLKKFLTKARFTSKSRCADKEGNPAHPWQDSCRTFSLVGAVEYLHYQKQGFLHSNWFLNHLKWQFNQLHFDTKYENLDDLSDHGWKDVRDFLNQVEKRLIQEESV